MVDTIKILDPVQGLVDYVNDIKPYHTKVIESLVEYVGQEFVNVSIFEKFDFGILLDYSVDNPYCEVYIAGGGEFVVDTQIQTTTNVKFVGSPPQRVYDYYGTVVYLNGVLQSEITTSTPAGDYTVTGINQITFTNALSDKDIVKICTATQERRFTTCVIGGFGSLGFDDPENIPVLSPDPTKTIPTFPAITNNSFIVLGDLRKVFDPAANLTFRIKSFIEDKIVNVVPSTGSPPTGGSFTVSGDKSAQYGGSPLGIFVVSGSLFNDTAYKITNVTTSGSPITTTLEVSGQIVASDDTTGFITTIAPEPENNKMFSVISSTYTAETSTIVGHTIVTVPSGTFATPATVDINQKYVSLISVGPLEYNRVLSYSNILKYYDSITPVNLYERPDEGVLFAKILGLSQTSPAYFDVEGNLEGSNVYVGDEFFVVNSTDNNAAYIIQSISTFGSPPITRFGVSSIHDSVADGFVKLNIPSNVFIITGDYTDFFKQGVRIDVITGSKTGTYTTAYSKFVNGETQIRVQEDIIFDRGRLIINSGSPLPNAFVVEGDVSSTFTVGTQFNVDLSLRNNGSYTVAAVYTNGSPPTETVIQPVEPFDNTDTTGEIHKFVKGSLKYLQTGFGETPELCEVVPETMIRVGIKERLSFNNIGIWTHDDLIAAGPADLNWGYELPNYTIFSSTQPTEPFIGPSAPATVSDRLWFDTSNNTGSPTAPGVLKQYIVGSPSEWIEVPNNKAYWIDTDTDSMYYRIMYQYYDKTGSPVIGYSSNVDTGWVLEYTKTPGYNALLAGNGTREQIGFETFFAVESSTSVAQTVFNFSTTGSPLLSIPLTTGSPIVPNPKMLEVYVNSAIALVNIISQTSFEIISPALRVGDFIEARVFDDTAVASNSFVGAFDATAAISENLALLKGYKFHIDGTEASSKTIHIPDTVAGDVYNIFMQGSPPTLIDNVIEIVGSFGSPNNDGIYTILSVTQEGSPTNHVVLTVAEPLLDTGIFSGSPLIESGKALYQQWFQYFIVNTTANTIVVAGDATGDISTGSPLNSIKIEYSLGSPNNDGIYTVSAISYAGAGSPYDPNKNTTITVVEPITNLGNSGGWVESI